MYYRISLLVSKILILKTFWFDCALGRNRVAMRATSAKWGMKRPSVGKQRTIPYFFLWFWWTLRLSCWIAAGFCRRKQWSFTELISAGRQMLAKSHFAAKGKLSFGNLTWLWKMVHFVRWFTFISLLKIINCEKLPEGILNSTKIVGADSTFFWHRKQGS